MKTAVGCIVVGIRRGTTQMSGWTRPQLFWTILSRIERVLAVTSPRLNRINSILIPLSCNFFSGSPSAKNSGVKRAWPGAISGWVTDREVFPGGQSEDKSAQKRLGLVCRARL
jgi:hypothetical protein